jgi:hypothetical protein
MLGMTSQVFSKNVCLHSINDCCPSLIDHPRAVQWYYRIIAILGALQDTNASDAMLLSRKYVHQCSINNFCTCILDHPNDVQQQ